MIVKVCALAIVVVVYLIWPALAFVNNGAQEHGKYTIALKRQKTSFEQHLNNAAKLKKYGLNTDWVFKKHHGKGGRTNDSIPLYRFLDNEFYGSIVIGHPGQILYVSFDTAWTASWVISSECQPYANIGCLFHNKYDHTKSSEYKPDGRPSVIPEGNFNLTGYFSYDNISISHSNVTGFLFTEMTKVPYTMLFSKIDGIMGLGLQVDAYEPFFYTMLRQGKIKNPVFCIYLNRDKQSKHGGNVILGFIEKRHIHSKKDINNNTIYDTIKYMAVKSGPFWKFDLGKVYVNQQTKETSPLVFCTSGKCTAIMDTSSNNIIGPRADIAQIHKAMKAKAFFLDHYTVDCDTINKLPDIAFNIGGQNFTLKGRDYTIKMSYFSVTWCLSAFVPEDYNDYWVLGGAFLSEYYTIYNVRDKQVGIVKAA